MSRYTRWSISSRRSLRYVAQGLAGIQSLPGLGSVAMPPDLAATMARDLVRVQGMIHSMTREERRSPGELIDESRRRRIAAGCGGSPREVADLVRQFEVMTGMMQGWGRGFTD